MKKPTPLRGKIFMLIILTGIVGTFIWYLIEDDVWLWVGMLALVAISMWLDKIDEKRRRGKKLRLAIDVHGVCDENPEFFSKMTQLFVENGHEVHVLTGRRISDGALDEINDLNIHYTHFMSIADYHTERGTKMWEDKDGNPWLDDKDWDRTKGDYCKDNNIDFCIDDTERYAEYFETPFAHIKIQKNEKVAKKSPPKSK